MTSNPNRRKDDFKKKSHIFGVGSSTQGGISNLINFKHEMMSLLMFEMDEPNSYFLLFSLVYSQRDEMRVTGERRLAGKDGIVADLPCLAGYILLSLY